MTVLLEFRQDQEVLERERAFDRTKESAAALYHTMFEMPVRIVVGESVIFDWGRIPIFSVADGPLRALRRLRPSDRQVVDLAYAVRLIFQRRGDVVQVEYPHTRSSGEAPYQELLAAWEGFAEDVRRFLLREVPGFADHPELGAWFRGEEE